MKPRRHGSRQSTQTRRELEDKIPSGPVTPELRRHVSIATEVIATDTLGFATVTRQKAVSKFDKLEAEGILTKAEAEAARMLRGYADAYFTGVTGAYQMSVDGSSRPGEGMLNKLHAAAKVTKALDHLNSELRRIAVTFILDIGLPDLGVTFSAIGASILPWEKHQGTLIAAGKSAVILCCRELAVFFRLQNEFGFDITKQRKQR